MMQRRNFLRGILGIAATAAASPLIKFLPAPAAPAYTTFLIGQDAIVSADIGQYADYINISDLALETSIDPALENIAKELSYRLRLTVDTLVNNAYDLRTQPYVIRKQYVDVARFNREARKERYLAKQRRRSARMAA